MRVNLLDTELTRTIQQVAKQHLNSFQPRPKGGPIVPGTGLAKLYKPPDNGSPGTAWQLVDNPITVENWMFDSISANKPIFLRKSRSDTDGTQIYVVIAEGCKAITAS